MAGCGRKKEPQSPPPSDSARSLQDAAEKIQRELPVAGPQMAKAMEAMNRAAAAAESAPVHPVNFRALREILPSTAAGLPRRSLEGQTQMGISQASARYADETGERSIEIRLIDSGSMRGVLAAGAAFMLNMDMDRETEDGLERTTTWRGYRLYEKQTGDGTEVKLLLNDRFLVDVAASGFRLEQLRKVLEEVPLKKIESLPTAETDSGNAPPET